MREWKNNRKFEKMNEEKEKKFKRFTRKIEKNAERKRK